MSSTDKSINTLTVDVFNLNGTVNIQFDTNFGDTNTNDRITAETAEFGEGAKFNLTSVNVDGDFDGDPEDDPYILIDLLTNHNIYKKGV